MRSLTVFALIALFIACAFVPPTKDGEVHATMFDAVEQQRTSAEKSLHALTKKSQNVLPLSRTHVDTALSVIHDGKSVASSLLTSLIAGTTNASERIQLERIQWAEQKQDPRLCGELMNIDGSIHVSYGNLLAACLARATRDVARCAQITGQDSVALRAACVEGLAQNG